ncbi:MAG: hypothetical protein Q8O89_02800 [Nanoarchaeota archaeon]|nr:hypothetical protein [Nanoarchaeota archaeon]
MSFVIGLLIYIVIFIALAAVGFFLLKSIFKALAAASGIMLVLTIILGLIVAADVKSLSENFKTKDKLILLTEQSSVLTGVKVGDVSKTQGKDFAAMLKDGTIVFVTATDVNSYASSLAQKDYDALLGSNYKLIMIDLKVFDSLQTVEFNKMQFSKDFIVSVIKSDSPADTLLTDETLTKMIDSGMFKLPDTLTAEQKTMYIEKAKQDGLLKKAMIDQFGSEDALKVILLGLMFNSLVSDSKEGPALLIEKYQDGNIQIYKESITFKLIKFMPVSLIKKFAGNMQPAATEQAAATS